MFWSIPAGLFIRHFQKGTWLTFRSKVYQKLWNFSDNKTHHNIKPNIESSWDHWPQTKIFFEIIRKSHLKVSFFPFFLKRNLTSKFHSRRIKKWQMISKRSNFFLRKIYFIFSCYLFYNYVLYYLVEMKPKRTPQKELRTKVQTKEYK